MKKYYIKTFGCAMNFSDSERLVSFLESYQFKPTQKIEQANLVIFNTCGVRQMAEDRVYGQVRNLRMKNAKCKIIVTGCLAHRKDVQKRLQDKVNVFCEIKNFTKKSKNYLSIKPKYTNKFSAYIPIMTGCNNFCSYCVVPYARGREISRPVEDILKEIKSLVKNGYQEITLLGQNVNSYAGKNKQNRIINFSQLLQKINNISGKFWIRFISSHPKDMSDELIEAVTKLEKVCEHIHLPIQAGDNAILKKMNRKYTQAHYLKLIEKIKKSFEKNKPNIIYSISSDLIVGFPGETKKQFLASAEIMKKVDYDMVYFGQFSPRPDTVAWNMKDSVTKKEKVVREKYLNEILKKSSLKNNKKYVGKIFEVLIEKKSDEFYYGRTRTFKNVKVKKDKNNLIGKIIKVKITKANTWNLEGKIYKREKIIVILGPTASGKSGTAIKLAKKFNGEIISADSRQIYRGMDIGSGKITKKEQKIVPHYMLDIINPKIEYNVAKFKKQALRHIEDILSRKKIPIICGGTGFWIKAIVDDIDFPQVKPNQELRNKLCNKNAEELFKKLKKLDPQRAKNIDAKNKVRLIRAIEICQVIGKVPTHKNIVNKKYEFFQIGISRPKEELHQRIKLNVEKRFKNGMVQEVKNLHKKGVSWKRLQRFGLSYALVPEFIKEKIVTREELLEKIYLAEKNYAKRQLTWFRKDKRIKWLKNYKEIVKETKKFLFF